MDIVHNLLSLYNSATHLSHLLTDAHDEMTSSVYAKAVETVDFLRQNLPQELCKPGVAIVCGSGLGGLAATVDEGYVDFAYKDVPNMPLSKGRSFFAAGGGVGNDV